MRVFCLPFDNSSWSLRVCRPCADLILLRQQYFSAVSMSDLFLNVDGQTIVAFLKATGKARLLGSFVYFLVFHIVIMIYPYFSF